MCVTVVRESTPEDFTVWPAEKTLADINGITSSTISYGDLSEEQTSLLRKNRWASPEKMVNDRTA
jgi:hypothetical protein